MIMRYAIFADIHANLPAFEAVVAHAQREGVDAYIFLGDAVGYGPYPSACIGLLQSLCAVCVAGNHDYAAAGLFALEYFNTQARSSVEWTIAHLPKSQKDFLAQLPLTCSISQSIGVHGSLIQPQDFNYIVTTADVEENFRVLTNCCAFTGHTHEAALYCQQAGGVICFLGCGYAQCSADNTYLVNVGSVGQPRDRDWRASYCMYDSGCGLIQIHRVVYDVDRIAQEMRSCGLPVALAQRLYRGQ